MPDLPAGETTLLALSFGLPPFSARGLKQSLEPINAAGQVRRTINGELIDFSDTAFQKYRSTITGGDQQPPAFDDLWVGRIVTVECMAELGYIAHTGSPGRSAVPGSTRTEGDYTFYRPLLTMMVTGLRQTTDEYDAETDWQLDLEEV